MLFEVLMTIFLVSVVVRFGSYIYESRIPASRPGSEVQSSHRNFLLLSICILSLLIHTCMGDKV